MQTEIGARDSGTRARGYATWVWDLSVLPLMVVLCGFAATLPMGENDAFLHVLMGRDILSEWRLTGNPDWTYGPADPDWVTFVHWPTQVAMAVGYDALGFGFFTALAVALAGAFLLVMFVTLRAVRGSDTVGPSRLQAGTLLFAYAAVCVLMGPRANAVSAIFAVLLAYWCLSIIRTGTFGMRWWIVPLATWVWVLLHGSAMFAILLLFPALALWWFIQPDRVTRPVLSQVLRLLSVAVAAAAVPALTPRGFQAWGTGLATREVSAGWIGEWSPIELASYEMPFVVALAAWAVLAGILAYRKRDASRVQSLAILALLWTAVIPAMLFQQRNYIVFMPIAIVSLFVITAQLLGSRGTRARSWETLARPVRTSGVLALGMGVCLAATVFASFQNSLDTDYFPVSIARNMHADENPRPRLVIAPIEVASVIPFYSPGDSTAFDARLDRYPREVLMGASRILYGKGGENWEQWIDDMFPGTTDILTLKTSPFVRQAQDAGWRITDESKRWVLLSNGR